jgi:glutathione synthase/RimK-type ligase-like ATP-grasp enzyme
MIDNRIHWVVKRDFFLRGPLRRTAVFTSEKIPVTSLSPQVVDIAHNIFRAWEGDFLVFDLINTHKGPMVLEAGLFAQFQSKEVPDNNNTPKALAKLIKTRIV